MPSFYPPRRAIASLEDLDAFKASASYGALTSFVGDIGRAVGGRPMSFECARSAGVEALLAEIEALAQAVDRFPPAPQQGRFGNASYREWYDAMRAGAAAAMARVLAAAVPGASPRTSRNHPPQR